MKDSIETTGFDPTPSQLFSPAPEAETRTASPRHRDYENEDLFTIYNRYFYVQPANNPKLLEEAYRLRYQIYCVEHGFEDPAQFPDGLERDHFDNHSAHCLLIYRKTNLIVGTVRLILPAHREFNDCLPIKSLGCRCFPVLPATTAEVSRFSVSKELRRRLTDGPYPESDDRRRYIRRTQSERRILPFITLGLISGLVQMSAEHRVTHWCAVMMPSLIKVLARLGIHFDPVGPMVEHHGRRQPSFRNLYELLRQCRQERPDVWDVITRKGTNWPPCLRSKHMQ